MRSPTKKTLLVSAAFAVAASLSGCGLDVKDNQPDSSPAAPGTLGSAFDFNTKNIGYDVDTRTGLCFAKTFLAPGYSSGMMGMSTVPCSEEVLTLVKPEKAALYKQKFGK